MEKLQATYFLLSNNKLNEIFFFMEMFSTVELGNKELFGHPKIVPWCQM